jgi:hypothetical protein
MRAAHASIVLLTSFVIPAVAHAAPVFSSFTLTFNGTGVTYQLATDPEPAGYFEAGSFYLDATARSTPGSAAGGQAIFHTAAADDSLYDSYFEFDSSGRQIFNSGFAAGAPSGGALDITAIPEPPTLVLLGSGLLCVAGEVWRRFGRTRPHHMRKT